MNITIITPAGIAAGLRALASHERETPPQEIMLHPSQYSWADAPQGEGHGAKVVGQ